MGDVVDPVQAAVEATFPLFEQHTDIPLLVQQMAEFSAQHIEAFSLISSPAHPRLMTQADNLCAFIRKDCQDLTDLDGYFLLMASFLRDIPISPNVFDEIGREFFSTKFEYLTDDIRRAVLEALAHNLISFNTIGVYHTIAEAKSEPRTPDELSFTPSDQERHTQELFHWIADSDDPLVFEVLGEKVLAHVFSLPAASPVYDAASLALWICIDHEKRRVEGNNRNNRDEPQSPMVGWFLRNQADVASSVLRGTWSTKYNPNQIRNLTTHIPQLSDIAAAMTLRSFDQKPAFLLDLRKARGIAPDRECIAIQKGQYNANAMTPTASSLESLMAYSLVYEDILGDDWRTPSSENPVVILLEALEVVEQHGGCIDQAVLEKLATRTLNAMKQGDDVEQILKSDVLKPFLNKNRNFQGIRLENDLGM